MTIRMVVATLVVAFCASIAIFSDDFGQDSGRLNGRWDVSERVVDGKVLPVESSPDKVWFQIENDDWQWSFVADGKRVTAMFTVALGDETEPRTIDAKVRNGFRRGTIYKGIYKFDGDALKLCLSDKSDAARPKTFESVERSNLQVFVMRRSKASQDRKPAEEVQ